MFSQSRSTAVVNRPRCPLDEESRWWHRRLTTRQIAVDAENHLIVAHEVVTAGIDRDQLTPMAEQARAATGIDDLTVVADRGYFKGEQILECDQAGITPIVPKTLTSNSLADGRLRQAGLHLHRRRR